MSSDHSSTPQSQNDNPEGELDKHVSRLLEEQEEEAKIKSIVKACDEGHTVLIADLATSYGGLLNDELRRRACAYIMSLVPSFFASCAANSASPRANPAGLAYQLQRGAIYGPGNRRPTGLERTSQTQGRGPDQTRC